MDQNSPVDMYHHEENCNCFGCQYCEALRKPLAFRYEQEKALGRDPIVFKMLSEALPYFVYPMFAVGESKTEEDVTRILESFIKRFGQYVSQLALFAVGAMGTRTEVMKSHLDIYRAATNMGFGEASAILDLRENLEGQNGNSGHTSGHTEGQSDDGHTLKVELFEVSSLFPKN